MAKRFSFSMFGSPPFRILADHLAQDEGFLTDARRVIALEAVQFEELARTLEEFDSFIDRDLLKQKVAEVLGPTEESKEIASTIWQLASMLREADEPFEKTVSILRSTFTEKMTELETDERQLLVDRIERLAAKPAGFNKQHKAQQLAEATGRELDEIQIICDIRPIFNDERTIVEGGIPVTTLHLAFLDASSESNLEIRLNEEQLNDLCDKTQAAIRKLTAIKSLLGEKHIVLPQTSATKTERDAV